MQQSLSRSQLQSRSRLNPHMRLSTLNPQSSESNFQCQNNRNLSQSIALQQQKLPISDQLELEFQYKYKKLICKISQSCNLGDVIQRVLTELEIREDVEFLQSQTNLTQYQKSLTLKDLKISDNQLIKILPKFQEGKILAKFLLKKKFNYKFKLKLQIQGQKKFQMNFNHSSALDEFIKILCENFPKYFPDQKRIFICLEAQNEVLDLKRTFKELNLENNEILEIRIIPEMYYIQYSLIILR